MTTHTAEQTYKHWNLLDDLPIGWKFDDTAGSPLCGYRFATNGKSVVNGQIRALVKIRQEPPKIQPSEEFVWPSPHKEPPPEAPPPALVNKLSREQMKMRLLADIKMDMMICEIEGWSRLGYLNDLRDLINGLGCGSSDTSAKERK